MVRTHINSMFLRMATVFLLLPFLRGMSQETLQDLEARRVRLPNGWMLTPVGASLPLGDLPLNIAVSRSRRYAAVTNNGQSVQTIQLFDVRADRQLDSVVIAKSWAGLASMPREEMITGSFDMLSMAGACEWPIPSGWGRHGQTASHRRVSRWIRGDSNSMS